MSNRAVLLARISDAEKIKADDGTAQLDTTGVDDQVQRLTALATGKGWTVAKVIIENDISAFKRRIVMLPNGRSEMRTVRPGFREALDYLTSDRADILVALDLDRAMRDPRDLEDLIDVVESNRPRVRAESVTGSLRLSNDADVTMARVMVAMANKSSRDTARRVSSARERQAAAGEFGGGRRPYGFEADGVTVRPDEAKIINGMADVVLLPTFGQPKGPSMKSIARDLREKNVPTADGKPWRPTYVRDVLMRPRNAALMVHRKGTGRKTYTPADVVGQAPWEPIISPEIYWAVVAKLADPSRRTNPGPAPKWLGSGIYRCPCGDVLRVHSAGDKADRPVYRCQSTGKGHATCPQAELDDLVETLAIVILARDAADLIKAPTTDVDVPALRAEVIATRQRRTRLVEDYAEEVIERPEYLAGVKRVNAKIQRLESRLNDVTDTSPLAPFAGVETEAEARKVWEGLGIGARRVIIAAIMTVTVQLVGRGKRPRITERVTIEPVKPAMS
ncbi:recombinase family protein [Streptosporangium sp. NBC_01755]|uniref:recombinase family protein n=1 Tax=unclassified Streptosporangium TaxID=2632669 RepID=UPI002DD92632|nr:MULTISPECIES: recombinase family protein [unclassified Streptosporangium]WSA23537.1 recombinase family protein [Streptosporangium sp. NBC_01810]WSC98255.1 recombinase family protein [Streptosporangium sp. NBC_01755]